MQPGPADNASSTTIPSIERNNTSTSSTSPSPSTTSPPTRPGMNNTTPLPAHVANSTSQGGNSSTTNSTSPAPLSSTSNSTSSTTSSRTHTSPPPQSSSTTSASNTTTSTSSSFTHQPSSSSSTTVALQQTSEDLFTLTLSTSTRGGGSGSTGAARTLVTPLPIPTQGSNGPATLSITGLATPQTTVTTRFVTAAVENANGAPPTEFTTTYQTQTVVLVPASGVAGGEGGTDSVVVVVPATQGQLASANAAVGGYAPMVLGRPGALREKLSVGVGWKPMLIPSAVTGLVILLAASGLFGRR